MMGHNRLIKYVVMIAISILIISYPNTIYAESFENILGEQLDIVDFQKVDDVLDEGIIKDYFGVANFKEFVTLLINGDMQFSFASFGKHILTILLKEVRALSILIGEIILLAIFSQMLKNLNVSFKEKDMNEIGFYAIYMTLLLILLKSFDVIMDLASNTIGEIYLLMESILPTLLMLVLASGNITFGATQGSVVLVLLQGMVQLIRTYIIPFIYFVIILEMINNISKQDIIGHLLNFIKSIITKAMKYSVIAFSIIMSVTHIIPNMLDGIINKGAKYAMNTIPVVGSALSGVVDTVLSCAVLIKSTVGIGAILIIIVMCLIPIIKIIAILFVYKLTASLVQPIADPRLVKGLSAVGDYSGLLLGLVVTVMFFFITAITILVVTTNMPMMMR